MANCPNCGSSHIALKNETNINWGRAVAGWALFGVVGGAVGAVTGEDRNANACLNCGTTWKAADLYKILRVIKNSTGVTLDLRRKRDRAYMNCFLAEVSPYIEAISEAEKQANRLIEAAQNIPIAVATTGCGCGFMASLVMAMGLGSSLSTGGFLMLVIIFSLMGMILALVNKSKTQPVEQDIERAKRQAKKLKFEAQENLEFAIDEFIERHPF